MDYTFISFFFSPYGVYLRENVESFKLDQKMNPVITKVLELLCRSKKPSPSSYIPSAPNQSEERNPLAM